MSRPPYAAAARTLLRDSVMDAVSELLAERNWAQVTMAEVATGAGVSRQTLYNEFGGRRELARAYVMREADAFLREVEAAVLAEVEDPHRALIAALETFLSAAADHPVVKAISSAEEGDELLALVTTRGGPLLEVVSGELSGFLRANWPVLVKRDADELSETLVRLAISHAALSTGSAQHSARAVARILAPRLSELLEGAGELAA